MKYGQSIIGDRYGRLTVLSLHSNINYKKKFLCDCDCGKSTIVSMSHLRTGHTVSCGCRGKETLDRTKHGDTGTKLYKMYHAMLARCHVPTDAGYPKYGAIGRSVCAAWKDSYEAFKTWAIKTGYTEGLSLDRKDNNGNYCPENCRWVTMDIQAINRGMPSNNTSGFKGVSFRKNSNRWQASITLKGKRKHLGTFDTAEEGYQARVDFMIKNDMQEHLKALRYDRP